MGKVIFTALFTGLSARQDHELEIIAVPVWRRGVIT